MSNHPELVKGSIGAVLGMSVNTALILGLHIHDVLVAACIALAVGILSGLIVANGLP